MATKSTLEKNSILKYFEIFKEKFFKIVILNIIFFTILTLLLIITFGFSYLIFAVCGLSTYFLPLVCVPLIALAPLVGAITKCCRDFVRREPGFFMEDLKLCIKNNWKQTTAIGIIQYIVFWVLYLALPFYYSNLSVAETSGQKVFGTVGLGVCMFVAVVAVFMSYYAYMMAVTLDLKLRELLKNAAIFSFLCLFRNILLTVVLGLWLALTTALVLFMISSANGLVYGLMIAFAMLLFFGFIFYTVAFFTFPPIKKYVIDPYYEAHPEQTASGAMKNAEINLDADKAEDEDLPELVYHNGRMVHRSSLESEPVFSDKRLLDNHQNDD